MTSVAGNHFNKTKHFLNHITIKKELRRLKEPPIFKQYMNQSQDLRSKYLKHPPRKPPGITTGNSRDRFESIHIRHSNFDKFIIHRFNRSKKIHNRHRYIKYSDFVRKCNTRDSPMEYAFLFSDFGPSFAERSSSVCAQFVICDYVLGYN